MLLVALAPAAIYAQQADTGQTAERAAPPSPPEGSVGGLGDVNLFPKRVVLNGRRQISTIGLFNKTTNEGDYEIKIVDMGMTSQGQLLEFGNGYPVSDQAKVKTASGMLRYSPRRVSLGGTESQTIRVMARAGADIPDGEYRSHFMVTSVPIDNPGGFSIENATGQSSGGDIGVSITPRFGIAIPIIVRIGETTLDVSISGAQLLTARDGSQAIGLYLNRSGTRSAFGDFEITARGAPAPIAISRGVGVYPELDQRQVIIPINPESDPRYLVPGNTITITYVDDDFEPGVKLAEHSFTIP